MIRKKPRHIQFSTDSFLIFRLGEFGAVTVCRVQHGLQFYILSMQEWKKQDMGETCHWRDTHVGDTGCPLSLKYGMVCCQL